MKNIFNSAIKNKFCKLSQCTRLSPTLLILFLSVEMIPGIDSFVFKKAACGSKHTMALNEWGQLFCWGANSHGQLGKKFVKDLDFTLRLYLHY